MRADRILVLKQGELIAQGSHGELLESSPLYRQLFIPSERIAHTNGNHLEWNPVTATQHNQELE
jgi:ATP-binding cassette subfamily B protein